VQLFPDTHYNYNFQLDFSQERINLEAHGKLSEQIDIFYRSLRSGINLKGAKGSLYFKSALFMYLHNQSIQWDKKTIKAEYFNKTDATVTETKYRGGLPKTETVKIKYLSGQQSDYENNGQIPDILRNPTEQHQDYSHKLYRDRLGLSSDEKWYSYRENVKKTEANFNGSSWRRKGEREDQISRYKSPIQFKVLIDSKVKKAQIYFDVFENSEAIKDYEGKMFNVYTKTDRVIPSLPIQSTLFMPIASRDNLEIFEFLKYTFNNIIPSSHIKKVGLQNELMLLAYSVLENAYRQLKTQNK